MNKLFSFFILFFILNYSYLKSQEIDSLQSFSYSDDYFEDNYEDENNINYSSGLEVFSFSDDIFIKSASNLSRFGFAPRGLNNSFNEVLVNGFSLKNHISGTLKSSNSLGLNFSKLFSTEKNSFLSSSEFTFGNLFGSNVYNISPSDYKKRFNLSYSRSNSNNKNQIYFGFSSGKMKNNWYFLSNFTHKWAEKGYFEGTYNQSSSYFLALQKKINNKHSLSFSTFGSPNISAGNASSVTKELHDLTQNTYNPYWGFQQGKIRNERIRKSFSPTFQFSYDFKLNDKLSFLNSFSYNINKNSNERLAYYKEDNPFPNHYQKMPSYFISKGLNPNDAPFLYEKQINWEYLYKINQNNSVLNLPNAYFTVSDILEDKIFSIFSNLKYKNKLLTYVFNFDYINLENKNYAKVEDLLGGSFVENKDQFSSSKNPNYNVDELSNKYYSGDKIFHNYDLFYKKFNFNNSLFLKYKNFDFNFSGFFSYIKTFRQGNFKHYLYLENSKGKSNVFSGSQFGIKSEIKYKFNNNLLIFNLLKSNNLINPNEVFISPKTNNLINNNNINYDIFSSDLSYFLNLNKLKIKSSLFFTDIKNQTEVSRYFAEFGEEDSQKGYVNEFMYNINKNYLGFEFGLEYKINDFLSSNILINLGQYIYSNNPKISLYSENEFLNIENQTAYLKNYKLSGSSQKAVSTSLNYNSKSNFRLNISANYLTENYIKIAPILRTNNFTINNLTGKPFNNVSEDLLHEVLKPLKFDDNFIINLSAGKSFKIKSNNISTSLNIINLLNNKNHIISGYEQNRKANFDDFYKDYSLKENRIFAPKFKYLQGLIYSFSVSYKF